MRKAIKIFFGIGLFAAASHSFCYVPQGHQMVLFDKLKGIIDSTYSKGIHFIVPFVQVPVLFDVRPSAFQTKLLVRTVDKEPVEIRLQTWSKPDESNLANLYRMIGPQYKERILKAIIQQSAKETMAKFSVKDIQFGSQKFLAELQETLKSKRLKDYFIKVLDIKIIELEWKSS